MNDVDTRITLARRWATAKVPFLHQGRDANGADCIGLLVYATGYAEGDIPAYSRDPHDGLLEAQLDGAFGPAAVVVGAEGAQEGDLRPGDLVAMTYGRRECRHVGIVAQHPVHASSLSMIHTDAMVGKVTEHILDERWLRRIRRVYR